MSLKSEGLPIPEYIKYFLLKSYLFIFDIL